MNITRRPNLRRAAGLGLTVAALVIGASACGSDNSADETNVPSTEMVVESQPVDAQSSNESVAPAEQETTAPVVAQPAAPAEDDSDHNDIPNESYVNEDGAVDPAAPTNEAPQNTIVIPTIKVPILPTTTMKIPSVLPTVTVSPTVISGLKVALSDFVVVSSSPLEVTFKLTEGTAEISRVDFAWSAPGLTGSGEATRVTNNSATVSTWRVGSMLANTTTLRISVTEANGTVTTFVKNF
jgi:hypothetical protein